VINHDDAAPGVKDADQETEQLLDETLNGGRGRRRHVPESVPSGAKKEAGQRYYDGLNNVVKLRNLNSAGHFPPSDSAGIFFNWLNSAKHLGGKYKSACFSAKACRKKKSLYKNVSCLRG
jgi:hypothetical protein